MVYLDGSLDFGSSQPVGRFPAIEPDSCPTRFFAEPHIENLFCLMLLVLCRVLIAIYDQPLLHLALLDEIVISPCWLGCGGW